MSQGATPSERKVPGYWHNETGPVLRPAIIAYLNGDELTVPQVLAVRAYFSQWMENGDWRGEGVHELRVLALLIDNRTHITEWLQKADDLGIDPL